jgi:hypothetical protein
MLEEAYIKVIMKMTQVYEWHKRFRDDCKIVNDDQGCVLEIVFDSQGLVR